MRPGGGRSGRETGVNMCGTSASCGRSDDHPVDALDTAVRHSAAGVDTTDNFNGESMEKYKPVLRSIGSREAEREG